MNEEAHTKYVQDCIAYLRHQRGLALMWLWLDRWVSVDGWSYDPARAVFQLSTLASARFLFGVPKPGFGGAGRPIFVGVQREEENWLSRLGPSRAVFEDISSDESDVSVRWLWIISEGRPSPDISWPDIPSVAIGIRVYPEHLIAWRGGKMDVRSVWWEEGSSDPRITSAPFAQLKVHHGPLASAWDPSRVMVKSFRERVLEKSTSEMLGRGLDHDPGYQGQVPALDSQWNNFVEPFRGAAPQIVEADYQGLFGQFLEETPRGPRQRPANKTSSDKE